MNTHAKNRSEYTVQAFLTVYRNTTRKASTLIDQTCNLSQATQYRILSELRRSGLLETTNSEGKGQTYKVSKKGKQLVEQHKIADLAEE